MSWLGALGIALGLIVALILLAFLIKWLDEGAGHRRNGDDLYD